MKATANAVASSDFRRPIRRLPSTILTRRDTRLNYASQTSDVNKATSVKVKATNLKTKAKTMATTAKAMAEANKPQGQGYSQMLSQHCHCQTTHSG